MNITLDFETCTILVRFAQRQHNCYAVLISRMTGESFTLTIPELIAALKLAAKRMRT